MVRGVGLAGASRSTQRSGWTALIPLDMRDIAHYLAYRADDGEVTIARVRPAGDTTDTTWQGEWSTGWTALVPMHVDGAPYVLAYRAGDGEFAIARVRADGNGTDTIRRGEWSTGWTALVPFHITGRTLLLAYNLATGEARSWRVRNGGQGLDHVKAGRFTVGWTALVPLEADGAPGYATLNQMTGDVAIDVIRDDGTFQSVWAGDVGTAWTNLVPFTALRRLCLLLYSRLSGAVEVRVPGPTFDVVFEDRWASGSTTLARVVVAGRPGSSPTDATTAASRSERCTAADLGLRRRLSRAPRLHRTCTVPALRRTDTPGASIVPAVTGTLTT